MTVIGFLLHELGGILEQGILDTGREDDGLPRAIRLGRCFLPSVIPTHPWSDGVDCRPAGVTRKVGDTSGVDERLEQ